MQILNQTAFVVRQSNRRHGVVTELQYLFA